MKGKLINTAEELFLPVYKRFPVIFDYGDGVYLYDTDGNEYLDFVSGIGVFALGYNNRKYNDALKAQIDKLLHTSNYYYNEPIIDAAKAVTKASGLDRVFFTNSGAEASEGCIKTARKYAFLKDGSTNHEIIALEHSFHGRTMGALSITGKKIYRDAFEPDIGNIKFAELNNIDSVKKQITDKTCAIIFETVQGEGGVYPATEVFLKEIRKICDENDILMILDEVQCGMGRTGYMFAYQKFGIIPDVVATAKALGCGVPVGAFLMKEKVAQNSLKAGDHGSGKARNEIFLETKLWLSFYEDDTQVDKTLERLGTDYIDLMILHQPAGNFIAGYQKLEKAYKAGKLKAIGVSNFEIDELKQLLAVCEIKPMVNQVETHPYYPQTVLREFMDAESIAIQAWYPLGGRGNASIMNEPVIKELAEKYGKSSAQIIMRWHVQKNIIVIPGSKTESHVIDNINIFDFSLTDEDITKIAGLKKSTSIFQRQPGMMNDEFGAARTNKKEFLEKMDRIIPWATIIALVQPFYYK